MIRFPLFFRRPARVAPAAAGAPSSKPRLVTAPTTRVSPPPPATPTGQEPSFLALVKARLGAPLTLTWTRNASTMVSFQRRRGHFHVRLQALFADATLREAEALVSYLKGERRAVRVLLAFVTAVCQDRPLTLSAQRQAKCTTTGRHHELQHFFEALNTQYFAGALTAQLTWGRAGTSTPRRQRSMQLGCYVHELNLIRIHPALDQAWVPDYVVQGVVFHEMIHAYLGPPCGTQRRRVHPPEFMAWERRNPDYERCCAWERQHVGRLMRHRPSSA